MQPSRLADPARAYSMHDLPPLNNANTQPFRSSDTAQRASNDTSAGSLVLNQQPGFADAEEEDTHDWESFNAQIERLLQSMQKSDKADYQARSSRLTPQQPVARMAGSTQPASYASMLGNTALRQNLAETAFELAARSPFQALRSLEPSAGSGIDAAASIALEPLQSHDEGAANGEEKSHNSTAPAEVLQQSTHGACCSKASAALGQAAKDRATPLEHDTSASPYLPLLQQIDWHIASCDASLATINARAEACVPPNADSQQHVALSAETDDRASLSLQPALAVAASAETEGMKAHNSGAISLEGLDCLDRELSVSLPSSEALQAALTAHAQSPQRRQGSAQLAWNAQDAQVAANAEEEDVGSQNGNAASATFQSDPQMLADLTVRAEGSPVLPAQEAFARLQTEPMHDSLSDMPAQPSPAPSTTAQHSVYGNDLYEPPLPALPAHLDVLEDPGDEQQPQLIPAHWPKSLAAPHAPAPSSAITAGAQPHASLPRAQSQALVTHTEAGEPPLRGMLQQSADADDDAGAGQGGQAAAAGDPSSAEAGNSPAGNSFRIMRLSLSPPCSSHKKRPSPGEQESQWQAQALPAEVVSGPHKENCSPELPSASQLQEVCEDSAGCCSAYADISSGRMIVSAESSGALDSAEERAHQLGVARLALEALAGEHAAELAQKATEVAYLSSMMGLTNDLLSTKQRKVQELSGEIAGLQDVLSEAGAEEVSQAMRMKELDIQVRQQRQQLSLVQQELALREQELSQCRAELALARAGAASPAAPQPYNRLTYSPDSGPGMASPVPAWPPPTGGAFLSTPPSSVAAPKEAAGTPASAALAQALHSSTLRASASATQRGAWGSITSPLSYGRRTTEALAAVIGSIRKREELPRH
ncbi:hypothetical protein CVIRNUC_001266 [Coccomyxa viridis]|uniref:Uncharacterized protein n=1 Tax=Coccomyxa viridis TaxID=1274662 RepID=A0AAV1HTK8_9CHLO|nr:hypothetical protein CVIRNUC_001266 [Coccomyxa viridis]